MTRTTNPTDREALSRRVADVLLHPLDHPTDVISEALSTVTGLADLLASHGDMAAFHGHSIEPTHIRGAASAITHQIKVIGALVEHLAEEARMLRRLAGETNTGEVAP